MNPWTVLLIGILLGWLIEYAVDWFFWRRKPTDEQIVTDLQNQLQASKEKVAGLEAQLAQEKSDSETLQTRYDELEIEVAAAEEAKEDEEYDHEEFRGSLKGKLAALGIGASAGAAIAADGDDEEKADESLPDEELTEAATDEPVDGESDDTEENVDASNESFDENSELEETDDDVESESSAETENNDEVVMETIAGEGDEAVVADADTSDEAEQFEEAEPMDQASESDEKNLDMDENGDSAETDMSDLAFDDESPLEGTDSPDGDAIEPGEGGQES
jgi:hypothetical protein